MVKVQYFEAQVSTPVGPFFSHCFMYIQEKNQINAIVKKKWVTQLGKKAA